MTGERKHGFAPAVPADARLLICGSLPGEASLAARQYYAHPRNRFWYLVGPVIGRPDLPALPYADRLAALAAAGIGLWDVYASARRAGSLDTAIRDGHRAPVAELVAGLAHLRAVAFNGGKAAAAGRRMLVGTEVELIDLPSSSPAYAAMPFEMKLRAWRNLEQFLR